MHQRLAGRGAHAGSGNGDAQRAAAPSPHARVNDGQFMRGCFQEITRETMNSISLFPSLLLVPAFICVLVIVCAFIYMYLIKSLITTLIIKDMSIILYFLMIGPTIFTETTRLSNTPNMQ
jgi:hypothetical protein